MIRETRRIADDSGAVLRLGYYEGYYGSELSEAAAEFSQKYPTVDIQITIGSHEKLYEALENDAVDLVLNDQRRAFSGAYNNVILSQSTAYIEISTRNPLSRLNVVETEELKNIPCILVANENSHEEERRYYEKIVGLKGDYIFAGSVQEARMKIVTGQGYMPVDVIGEQKWFDTAVSRIPLVRNSEPVTKTYCAFWQKDNLGYYIEEFADILKEKF